MGGKGSGGDHGGAGRKSVLTEAEALWIGSLYERRVHELAEQDAQRRIRERLNKLNVKVEERDRLVSILRKARRSIRQLWVSWVYEGPPYNASEQLLDELDVFRWNHEKFEKAGRMLSVKLSSRCPKNQKDRLEAEIAEEASNKFGRHISARRVRDARARYNKIMRRMDAELN